MRLFLSTLFVEIRRREVFVCCAVRPSEEKAAPRGRRDALPTRAAGQNFYNTSEYSPDELIRRPADIVPSFAAYLAGFSANVKDTLYNFSGGEEEVSPRFTRRPPASASRASGSVNC